MTAKVTLPEQNILRLPCDSFMNILNMNIQSSPVNSDFLFWHMIDFFSLTLVSKKYWRMKKGNKINNEDVFSGLLLWHK